ncbi:MAG: ABC transporter permease, partial [Acidimicrobiales bacterium]|nr:ABC transporter permease [Acidimicrobiales bacterium]
MIAVLRLTLRSLRANKIRLALTTVAVVLGVSFIVASFVLADGLNDSFDELAGDITSGTDLAVRPVDDFGTPQPMDESVADLVAGVEGVAAVAVQVSADNVMPVRADGTTIPTTGPPQLGF